MTTPIPYPPYIQIPATFAQLAVGATVAADFAAPNEADWFRVELVAGQTYLFSLDGTLARDGAANPQLSMVGATGRLHNTVSTGPTAGMPALPFTPSESGTYYLRASGFGNTGAYTMSAAVKPADDVGDIPLTAAVLAVGASVNGTLGLINDADLFAVDLSAGQLYSFRLEGRDGSVLPAVSMQFESNSNGVGYRLDKDANIFNPTMSGVADTTGTYYLKVNSTSATADYTLRATAVADDFTAIAAGSGALAVGTPLAGTINANNDRDWFAVQLEAGIGYQFGVTQQAGAAAVTLAMADNSPARATPYDASRAFTPYTSGTYYLEVAGALPSEYQLSVTRPADDFDNNWSPGAPMTGGTATGVTNYLGDTDYFSAPVVAGSIYRALYDTALSADWMSGYGVSGATAGITETRHGAVGDNQYEVYFRADSSGNAVVRFAGDSVGAYAISVQKVGVDDYANDYLHATPLERDSTLQGSMDGFGDADAFSVFLVAGRTYEVIARSDLGPALDVSQDPTYTDWNSNGHFTITAMHTGEQVVYVHAGNAAGNYDLSLSVKANSQLQGVLDGARVDAGGGFDTIRFDGQLSDYTVTRSGFDHKLSTSAGGSATLANVERVLFANGDALALDIAGVGGSAYRLYSAAFDRTPDKAGVSFWMNAMDQGYSLVSIAGEFVRSAEFTTLYGAASTNADFVTRLYSNILDRAGDQDGFDFWVNALESGYSRAYVLASFSESAENAAAVALLIGNGFEYIPFGG